MAFEQVLDDALVAQLVKSPPAMRETLVRSLGQEDLLEKEMATHTITLAWRIPWTREPGLALETNSVLNLYSNTAFSCLAPSARDVPSAH